MVNPIEVLTVITEEELREHVKKALPKAARMIAEAKASAALQFDEALSHALALAAICHSCGYRAFEIMRMVNDFTEEAMQQAKAKAKV